MRAWRLQIDKNAPSTTPRRTSVEIAQPLALPDRPSIAVLPFQNMSGDPEQEYFADGIVEDIITGLSKFKSLFVIARNSSLTYKGQSVNIKQLVRELGVRFDEAYDVFAKAFALDPNYAAAYAMAAQCLTYQQSLRGSSLSPDAHAE